jgi:hypothetical protein
LLLIFHRFSRVPSFISARFVGIVGAGIVGVESELLVLMLVRDVCRRYCVSIFPYYQRYFIFRPVWNLHRL